MQFDTIMMINCYNPLPVRVGHRPAEAVVPDHRQVVAARHRGAPAQPHLLIGELVLYFNLFMLCTDIVLYQYQYSSTLSLHSLTFPTSTLSQVGGSPPPQISWYSVGSSQLLEARLIKGRNKVCMSIQSISICN